MKLIWPDGGTTIVSPGARIRGIHRLGARPEAVQLNYADIEMILTLPHNIDTVQYLMHLQRALKVMA